jgi:hypothetical protein
MNRTKRRSDSKKLAVLLSVILIVNCAVPQAQAGGFWSAITDFFGGVFTVITAPIWVFCPDNPTFRKNNPFRTKVWEEQAQEEERKKLDKPPKKNRFVPPEITRDPLTPTVSPPSKHVVVNKDDLESVPVAPAKRESKSKIGKPSDEEDAAAAYERYSSSIKETKRVVNSKKNITPKHLLKI